MNVVMAVSEKFNRTLLGISSAVSAQLSQMGYSCVEEPKNGDVVVYCSAQNIVNHYGRVIQVAPQVRVISKFGVRAIA